MSLPYRLAVAIVSLIAVLVSLALVWDGGSCEQEYADLAGHKEERP